MIITDIESLHKLSEPVDENEADVIIKLLEEELKKSPRSGIGLAAPQIGTHKRVAIIRTNGHSVDLVNPQILEKYRPIIVRSEGCLSLPNIFIDTCRFDEIVVICDNNIGGFVATGLEALAIQHEIDHLNGILITDRISMKGTGRNDLCQCGSKLKYKKCHGR